MAVRYKTKELVSALTSTRPNPKLWLLVKHRGRTKLIKVSRLSAKLDLSSKTGLSVQCQSYD
jgi:hypothetical protein